MATSVMPLTEAPAQALLRVAEYLSRPQHFVAMADARAALRRTMEQVPQASVVLTSNGTPVAALVPFAILEALRSALLHLLVGEMEASFARQQAQVASEPRAASTSEEDLATLVADAVYQARHHAGPPLPPTA